MINYTKQHTLARSYTFKGKGLHTGVSVTMTINPAGPDTGVVFHRVDLGPDACIQAVSDYVTTTSRGTTLEKGQVKISTLEHLMATFYGMHIDNVLVEIDAPEVPILDGSAKYFAEAISADGIVEQDAERRYLEIKEKIYFRDEQTGSEIVILPYDSLAVNLMIDFNSKVLGNQYARYNTHVDFAKEIAPCRTFVFFHELEPLFKNNLIKGGDLDNAIIVVEHPVPQEELDRLANVFNVHRLERAPEGYLNHLELRFSNECARHKLLDILGDFALVGAPIKGMIVGYKTGHRVNTLMAARLREIVKQTI